MFSIGAFALAAYGGQKYDPPPHRNRAVDSQHRIRRVAYGVAVSAVLPDWDFTPAARALLAKIDAFERMADRWSYDCPEAALGFSEAVADAECALDNLRSDALHDVMTASCTAPYDSDEYHRTREAADETLISAEEAIQSARRNGLGDDILRNANG